jgi:hypothetical protein
MTPISEASAAQIRNSDLEIKKISHKPQVEKSN